MRGEGGHHWRFILSCPPLVRADRWGYVTGGDQSVNRRVLHETVRHRPVSPAPPPPQPYMHVGGLQSCLQCVIGLSRTSARRIPGFVRLEREREAPTRSAHLRTTGANAQLAT